MPKKLNLKRKVQWDDQIRLSDKNAGPIAERSRISAGPNSFITIVVTRESGSIFYVMECNVICDRELFRSPSRITLSAATMQQAKEEAADRVRILLHHALSDL